MRRPRGAATAAFPSGKPEAALTRGADISLKYRHGLQVTITYYRQYQNYQLPVSPNQDQLDVKLHLSSAAPSQLSSPSFFFPSRSSSPLLSPSPCNRTLLFLLLLTHFRHHASEYDAPGRTARRFSPSGWSFNLHCSSLSGCLWTVKTWLCL